MYRTVHDAAKNNTWHDKYVAYEYFAQNFSTYSAPISSQIYLSNKKSVFDFRCWTRSLIISVADNKFPTAIEANIESIAGAQLQLQRNPLIFTMLSLECRKRFVLSLNAYSESLRKFRTDLRHINIRQFTQDRLQRHF